MGLKGIALVCHGFVYQKDDHLKGNRLRQEDKHAGLGRRDHESLSSRHVSKLLSRPLKNENVVKAKYVRLEPEVGGLIKDQHYRAKCRTHHIPNFLWSNHRNMSKRLGLFTILCGTLTRDECCSR